MTAHDNNQKKCLPKTISSIFRKKNMSLPISMQRSE